MWNRRQSKPTAPVVYPVGTFVRTEKGVYYISSSVKRLKLISKRIVDSWSPPRIVETSEAAVANYKVSAKMKFRNGTLVHSLEDGVVYLIVGGKRCPMVSPEAFERLGVTRSPKHVVTASAEELRMHELGAEIS